MAEKIDPKIAAGNLIEVPATNNRMFAWLFDKSGLRRVIGVCNSLLNLEINFPISTGATTPPTVLKGVFSIASNKAIITAPLLSLGGAATNGSVPFSGNGAPSAATLSAAVGYLSSPVPSLYVDMTASALYVCTTAGTNVTSVWSKISSGGGVQQFMVVAERGNYLVCKSWDGTTLGSAVNIAKPYKIRTSITSEIINLITHNYSYSGGGPYTRTDAYYGVTESQVVTPPYLANDIIYAASFATTTPADLAAVTLLDINADGRTWAH